MMLHKTVIIGPESTGKSTLSAALAAELATVWVPEYARSYLDGLGREYVYQDLQQIAIGQLAMEDELTAKANKHLICDTDLYVLKVWSEHRYGRVADFILQTIAQRPYDAYILCDIDMPWAADPMREHPEAEMRRYFLEVYKDIVQQSGRPFVTVHGSEQERLATALAAPWFGRG